MTFAMLLRMMEKHFRHAGLTKPLVKNLAYITYAFFVLSRGGRSGHGRLSLSALSRALTTSGTQKSKFKRLSRFLKNSRFTPEVMIPYLITFVMGRPKAPLTPVVVDQTSIGGIPVLMAGLLFSGRVLPIGFTCFLYETFYKSQNTLEAGFLTLLKAAFPRCTQPVFILDRGYGRQQMLHTFHRMRSVYIVRAKRNVLVWVKNKPLALGRLKYTLGKPKRYRHVLYRKDKKEAVDIVVYAEQGFKEVWYLLVPTDSQDVLPTQEVVRLYRERMQIEQGFRDWKTHLGVRGLKLQVTPDVRLCRLLLSLCVAYSVLLLLGASPYATAMRPHVETPRCKPRHGTRKTLSVLTLGMVLWSLCDIYPRIIKQLKKILLALRRTSVLALAASF